jgi:hypothetical protein
MDSITTVAEDNAGNNEGRLPPASKGKRKALDPAAGSSKRRSRAGVSGFGSEDVEMNNI